MLVHIADWCGIVAAGFFAASIFFLRRTVLSMLDAGPVTHNIWKGIRAMSWPRRFGFAFRALGTGHLPGTPDQGWSEMLRTRFTQQEVELFDEAERMGKVPPVYPVQVVAAARTAAWGWLCALSALIAFIAQVVARVLAWLA